MRKRFTTVERLEEVARTALYGGYGRMMTTSETDVRAPVQYRRVVVLDIKHNCEAPYMYGHRAVPRTIRGLTLLPCCALHRACSSYI